MPKPKKTDPRNQFRGTRLTQLRLSEETLTQVARIRAHLAGPDGFPICSVADAIRYAIKVADENISAVKLPENPGKP